MAYSTSCLKFVVLSFSIIFAMSAVTVVIVSVANLVHFYTHRDFIPTNVSSPVLLLALTGIAACGVAALGWCGAMAADTCRLFGFAALLVAVVVVQFGGGVWALASRAEFLEEMTAAMELSFSAYVTDDAIIKKWDSLQQELECCGTDGPEDYRSLGAVSWTCCVSKDEHQGSCQAMRQRGCLDSLSNDVRQRLLLVALMSMAASLVQVTGVFCTCCLSNSLKNDSRRNRARNITTVALKT